jgi:hypothetical protein
MSAIEPGGGGRPPPRKRDSRPAGTEAANLETTDNRNRKLNSVTIPSAQDHLTALATAPFTRIGEFVLLDWQRCTPPATERVGIATVLLPSGKLGGFAIYCLRRPCAEWWPTARLRRVRRRDYHELNAALPSAVALVRKHDPDALLSRGLLPPQSRFAEAAE